MRPRDALIVAAVLLLGGVALADSLRGRGASTQPATTSGTTTEREDRSRPEQFPGLQVGGSLVFTTARECLVREVDVSTGLEFPVPPIRTACDLWAPARTERVAVSTGSRSGEALPFRFVDLNHPERDVGASRARFGVVLWSPDGQWAAWCDVNGGGFLVELGEARRRIAGCPRAVTDDGRPAYVAGPGGNVVEAGGRRLLAASGFVAELHPGVDGS